MKILVSGASGFMGSALCAKLQEQGHELTLLDSRNCDLTKQGALNCFNDKAFEQIYHLAAWTQPGDFCLYHPGEQWVINQHINTNVLDWWQKYQPHAKLISIGTSCAYDPTIEPTEENYLTGMPTESLFAYAMTKRMLYAGLLALHKQFDLRYLYLVPDTLYGPGYYAAGKQMHFIFDIIRKIMRGKIYGETVVLWGDGYQLRELVYLEDFIRVMLRLSTICDNEIINVACGQQFTIRHFAQFICEKLDYDFNSIKFDTSQYVGAKSKHLIPGKLKSIIPDAKFTPLPIGLNRTIEWFLEHKDSVIGKK